MQEAESGPIIACFCLHVIVEPLCDKRMEDASLSIIVPQEPERLMDVFHERLTLRAATIDELLSDDFEVLPGQKSDADLAARRLAAWCQSCASGDWSLFNQRLGRDGWTIDAVLKRFATVRRKASVPAPPWLADAIWIEAALQSPRGATEPGQSPAGSAPCAFEDLLMPVVHRAADLLWSGVDRRAIENLTEFAHACLARSLLKDLSDLSAPAIYEQFVKARNAAEIADGSKSASARTTLYDRFAVEMSTGGFRSLFEAKPILLRLMAVIVRQWIETSREFVLRLDADLPAIRRDILRSNTDSRVARVDGDLSDPHNGGRSVRIVSFEDGLRVVYKPKDLRLDIAWHKLVQRLNGAGAPIELRAVRAIAPDGYGWTEFVDHTEYADQEGDKQFFRRAGAWLALFHCFVANDMHQENMIAAGDHPVPIDLETILQSTAEGQEAASPAAQTCDAATDKLVNSVMMVGLLPAYGRSPDNKVFAIGGMTADWNSKIKIVWDNINSDAMRPKKSKETGRANPNLPHIDGRYARFADHVDDFVSGFEAYAKFLLRQARNGKWENIYEDFA